jgi:hypothetical protein
MIRQITVCL